MDLGNLPARFAPKDNPLRFRQGSIVSVEADQCTLTVTIAGSTVPISGVRYATGVMPVPGLAVWLATDGRDLWAIATLMTTDTTPWGYYVDYTFARGATQPATPTGNIPASPPWYGSPPVGTTPLWMSEATKNPQGVVVGSWSLPVQLTGDPGPAWDSAPLVAPTAPTFGTGWSAFSAVYPVTYWKDAMGIVHLTGVAKRTSGTVVEIFTLPAGCRPASGVTRSFATQSGGAFASVNVDQAGVVTWIAGAVASLALDGISFLAGA